MLGSDVRSVGPNTTGPNFAGETSVVALTSSMFRHGRLIASLGVVGMLVGGVFGLTRPHTYTAHASFTADDDKGTLSGSLGAQFGLGALLGSGSPSAQLYLDLLDSPVILGPVADSTYTVTDGQGSRRRVKLVEFYKGRAKTRFDARENAIEKLAHAVKGELRPSLAVAVAVTTTNAALSQQIAARILGRVNEFNLERRQQRAATERVFNEERVGQSQDQLRAAEARLQAFLQDNRAYRNAPALTFEEERLKRNVDFRQTIYTAVAQAYEQARVEESRNTPTISIVEPALLPGHEDLRWGGLKSGLLGLVVGISLGLAIAIFQDFFGRSTTANPNDAEELAILRDRSIDDRQRAASVNH